MAVDWSKLSLLDTVSWKGDAGGESAYARYYLLAQDIAFRPHRGDKCPVEVDPLRQWKVDSVDCAAVSRDQYIVSVTFRRFISGSAVGRSYKNLKKEWELEMGLADYHLTPDFWGVTRAEAQSSAEPIVAAGSRWVVAVNAGAGAPLTRAAWGALLPADLPVPFTQFVDLKYIDRTVKCRTFTVTFYRDDSHGGGIPAHGRFYGINGTIPGEFDIPDDTDSGAWLAVDQKVTRVLDEAGDPFYRIVRTAMHTPDGVTDYAGAALRWSSTKNGGTWTWPTWP